MEEKEYLNEEKYKKANKKVKVIGIIIMLIGLSLIGFGIYTIITANKIEVPNMGDPNWYSISSNQMGKQATGGFMIIPGIFLTVVGLMVRFLIGNRREIMAYQMQQLMPIVKEGTETVTPIATKAAKEITEEMTPTYANAAKEIAKGIKEGLKDKE